MKVKATADCNFYCKASKLLSSGSAWVKKAANIIQPYLKPAGDILKYGGEALFGELGGIPGDLLIGAGDILNTIDNVKAGKTPKEKITALGKGIAGGINDTFGIGTPIADLADAYTKLTGKKIKLSDFEL
jgi:hypothetical protein